MKKSVKERILERCVREEKTGCLLWQGCRFSTGYGAIGVGPKLKGVHRVMYELEVGPIPEGKQVCHRCDVRNCCEPSHLFVGSAKENMQDAARKGRMAKGARHNSKARPETVVRGDDHWARRHPEWVRRGDQHWCREKPERVARGERHSSRTHPESLPRGDRHYKTKITEAAMEKVLKMYDSGEYTIPQIAEAFEVHKATIFKRLKKARVGQG